MAYSIPCSKLSLPPDRAPIGSSPFGVRPFSWSTLSLSSLQSQNILVTERWARSWSRCTGSQPAGFDNSWRDTLDTDKSSPAVGYHYFSSRLIYFHKRSPDGATPNWGNRYLITEASNFKFGTQLEFAKAHHKITPRGKVGVVLG